MILATFTRWFDKVSLSKDAQGYVVENVRRTLTSTDVSSASSAEDESLVVLETAAKVNCGLHKAPNGTLWFPVQDLERVLLGLHKEGLSKVVVKHSRTSKAPF